MINEFQKLTDLTNLFHIIVPDGTEKDVEYGEYIVHVSKHGDELRITMNSKEDNSGIKEIVEEFKSNIEDLDDDIFLDAFEDMKEVMNVDRFNELLDKDNFTKDEAIEVLGLIDQAKTIICENIETNMSYLEQMYDKFRD